MKILSLALLMSLFSSPALACVTCSSGGSGSSADLGTIGGAASLFSGGNHWLIQSGGSFRQVTGTFNELGKWNPAPSDSLLQSYTGILGVMYFPDTAWSVGLQVPFLGNLLSGATWGSFGSITPTDTGASFGGGIGDLQLQSSYKFWEGEHFALAGWGGLSLPTGPVNVDNPVFTTGSGMPAASAGLLALYQLENEGVIEGEPSWWETLRGEVFVNLGYSQAFGTPPAQVSPFFQGQSLLYQLQGNVQVFPGWITGLGLNGQLGTWHSAAAAAPRSLQWASRLKLVPSVQYEICQTQGIRLAAGFDLPVFGSNSLTDVSVFAVYYQFFN